MTIDQLIALSASIGAFVSAFATFLTIREMKKQREESYRPELVVLGGAFECVSDPKFKGNVPTLWIPSQNGVRQDKTSFNTYLSLYNIGLGSAKKITITWDYTFDVLVRQLNDLTNKYLSTSFFSFENELLSFDSEKYGKQASNWKIQKQNSLNYTLPSNTQTDSVQIILPSAYILMVSSIVYFCAITKDVTTLENIPDLKVNIEYYDIANNKHSVIYCFKFKLSAYIGNGEKVFCYLESKSSDI